MWGQESKRKLRKGQHVSRGAGTVGPPTQVSVKVRTLGTRGLACDRPSIRFTLELWVPFFRQIQLFPPSGWFPPPAQLSFLPPQDSSCPGMWVTSVTVLLGKWPLRPAGQAEAELEERGLPRSCARSSLKPKALPCGCGWGHRPVPTSGAGPPTAVTLWGLTEIQTKLQWVPARPLLSQETVPCAQRRGLTVTPL